MNSHCIIAGAVTGVLLLTASLQAAEKPVKITPGSVSGGFFYKSSVVADGAVQLSPCTPMSGKNMAPYKGFGCSASGAGYRCTGKGLDVVFLFDGRAACEADHSRTLNADEEGS